MKQEIETYIKNIREIDENGESIFIERLLKDKTKKIEKLEKRLNGEKMKLVFIGDSGVGKSTIISNLFNVFASGTKENEIIRVMPADKGGKTTPCEVEIYFTDNENKIVIENIVNGELQKIVKAYLKYHCLGDEDEEVSKFSEELTRIIENILGEEFVEKAENLNVLEAEKLIELSEIKKRLQEFEEEVYFDFSCENNDLLKMQELLEKINRGEEQKVGVPKKIEVYIDKNLLQIEIPEWISSIVDTRGIGSDSSESKNLEGLYIREDLRNYIKADDTIIVYINKYIDLSPKFETTFNNLWNDKDMYLLDKLILLINVDEAEVVSKLKDEESAEEKIKVLRKKEANFKKSLTKKDDILNIVTWNPLEGKEKVKGRGKYQIVDRVASEENIRRMNDFLSSVYQKVLNRAVQEKKEEEQICKSIISNNIGKAEILRFNSLVLEFEDKFLNEYKPVVNKWKEDYSMQMEEMLEGLHGNTAKALIVGDGTIYSTRRTIIDIMSYKHDRLFKLLEQNLNDVSTLLLEVYEEKFLKSDEEYFFNQVKRMIKDRINKYCKQVDSSIMEFFKICLLEDSTNIWDNMWSIRQNTAYKYADILGSEIRKLFDENYSIESNQIVF